MVEEFVGFLVFLLVISLIALITSLFAMIKIYFLENEIKKFTKDIKTDLLIHKHIITH